MPPNDNGNQGLVEQYVLATININGKEITPFSQLSLRQRFNEHHYFEIHFDHDVLEEDGVATLDKSKDFLGKAINISFTAGGAEVGNNFKGIVTDIRISNGNDIIFSGYSATILLETGESNASYLASTLNKIVSATATGVPSNDLAIDIKPVKTSPIPYCVQYQESNFAFMRRLAAEYGEYFFYDGAKLCFGKQSSSAQLSLALGENLTDLDLSVRLAPLAFEQVGYLSKEDKSLRVASSSQQVAGLDAFGKLALSVSDQVFKGKSNSLSSRKFLEAKELDESVKIAKSTSAGSFVVVAGSSIAPQMKPGMIVSIGAANMQSTHNYDYGNFTITSVSHHLDGLSGYHNQFEAIPSTIAVVPNNYGDKQIAEPQMGIVTDNKDPDKLGKVKVKLLWQKDNDTTPYIRVLTPHGGTYKDGKKTRGQFFTPEVGEMVIVGFTQNDSDRPFVMGSLPNGKMIDSAPNTDNNIKSISTRSGNIISFLDKDGEEQEIKIQTDDTNYISINLKKSDGMIKIYSSKAIEVNSKETITVKSGKDITVQGDKTINVKSEKITIEATDTISLSANKKIEIKAPDISIEASKGLEAKGGATVKIEGAQTEISGSATAKLTGAMLNVEASGINTIKGSMVMIN